MPKKWEIVYLILFGIFTFCALSYGSYIDFMNLGGDLSAGSLMRLLISYLAGVTGVLCVVFGARESIWTYFFGIISIILWISYVVFWSPLLWEALVNVVYLVLSIYGLYYWLNPDETQKSAKSKVALTRLLTGKERIFYTIGAIFAISVLTLIGLRIGRYAHTLQALTDAASTVLAILGQWFISLKVFENWYMWMIVNLINIPLYISAGSYTLAMVWVAFFINAVYGYILWKKNMAAY